MITPTARLQFKQIQEYINVNSISNDTTGGKKWKLKYKDCNYQQNSDDCGVYMLTFCYILSDFSSSLIAKDIDCNSSARVKIAMDITRGYIEDPRLKGYKYFGDTAKPSLLDIPPFLDYENFMIDLTNDDSDDEKKNDEKKNDEKIVVKTTSEEEKKLQFQLYQKQLFIESLQMKIDQDQEEKQLLKIQLNNDDADKNNSIMNAKPAEEETELNLDELKTKKKIKNIGKELSFEEIEKELYKKKIELQNIEEELLRKQAALQKQKPPLLVETESNEIILKIKASMEDEMEQKLLKQKEELEEKYKIDLEKAIQRGISLQAESTKINVVKNVGDKLREQFYKERDAYWKVEVDEVVKRMKEMAQQEKKQLIQQIEDAGREKEKTLREKEEWEKEKASLLLEFKKKNEKKKK
jgi:hypothetical protein